MLSLSRVFASHEKKSRLIASYLQLFSGYLYACTTASSLIRIHMMNEKVLINMLAESNIIDGNRKNILR